MKKVLTRNVTTIIGAVGFRLPTEDEWVAEIATWDTEDAAGAFGGVLKLTLGGIRNYQTGVIELLGVQGEYRTSTISFVVTKSLLISNLTSEIKNNSLRSSGCQVRLIADGEFISHTPKNLTIDNLTYNTVFNPTTGKVWLDRNLGATQVATSSTDSDAYGDLYQWGRYRDGHEKRTSLLYDGETNGRATTEEPNAGNDWDGKFITTDNVDWLTPRNDNLWQGVDGINNPGIGATTTVKKILTRNGKVLVRVFP